MKTNRILIVDDKEDNLYLLFAAGPGMAMTWYSAIDGADAVTKAGKTPWYIL